MVSAWPKGYATWLCLHWWGLTAQFYPAPLPQLGIVAHSPGPLCSGESSPFLSLHDAEVTGLGDRDGIRVLPFWALSGG